MNQYFVYTIQMLESKNDVITNFQIRVCDLEEALSAKRLSEEIKIHIELCMETQDKDALPFYYLLTAHCYLFVDKLKEAVIFSTMAIDYFRVCGMAWNEAIGHWFLGLVYRTEKRGYLYLSELNKTLDIINPIAAEYLIQGNYQAAMKCEQVNMALEEQKAFAAKMGTGPLHPHNHPPTREKQAEKAPKNNSGYLTLPWLPKYDKIRAGLNGPIWVDPPLKSGAIIHTIEIDRILCQIISIHSYASNEDHQINLVHGINYGWSKVEGQSMNASIPVPIEDGDYVLFSTQWHEDRDCIVIAARFIADNEYAPMVKKYYAKNRTLISETIDTAEDYSPIHHTKYQILGTVIAIAKPIQ